METWALVIVTLGLVWATWQLARHTRTLSGLTEQLVIIEQQREERTSREKRRNEIAKAYDLGESICSINEVDLAADVQNSPQKESVVKCTC